MESMRKFMREVTLLAVVFVGFTITSSYGMKRDAQLKDFAGAPADKITAMVSMQDACRDGDVAIVAQLLDAGADVNELDPTDGVTPLHTACDNNHAVIVDMLLRAGANPNLCDRICHATPLHWVVFNEHVNVEILDMLLRAGANPNMVDLEGHNSVFLLAINKRFEVDATDCNPIVIQLLIDAGADVNFCNEDGDAALHSLLEIIGNSDKIDEDMDEQIQISMDIIIRAGGNVNQKNGDGMTPLHLACKYGNEEMIRMLLINGADTSIIDDSGQIPLSYAVDTKIEQILTNAVGILSIHTETDTIFTN